MGENDAKCLVDLVRFELTTSSMPWKRAPNCATGPFRGDNLKITQHPEHLRAFHSPRNAMAGSTREARTAGAQQAANAVAAIPSATTPKVAASITSGNIQVNN